MDEIEVPTEHLHEAIHEKVEKHHEEKESGWNMYVAISTALIAVLAAVAALMAGHHSNEALIQQIRSSDQWSYYQAKGIKAEIKILQIQAGKADSAELVRYRKEQEEIKEKAARYEELSEQHLSKHVLLARAVTLFQISIAGSAIAILTRKKYLWYGTLLLSLIGAGIFAAGLL